MIYDLFRATGASEAAHDVSDFSMFSCTEMTFQISIQDGNEQQVKIPAEHVLEGAVQVKSSRFCSTSDSSGNVRPRICSRSSNAEQVKDLKIMVRAC